MQKYDENLKENEQEEVGKHEAPSLTNLQKMAQNIKEGITNKLHTELTQIMSKEA